MAQLIRVLTANPGATSADDTFATLAPFPEVRVNVEASGAEAAAGASYEVGIIVRDEVTNTVAAPAPVLGSIGTAPWNPNNATITFPLPPAITAIAAAGRMVTIRSYCRVGAAGAGASADFGYSEFLWV